MKNILNNAIILGYKPVKEYLIKIMPQSYTNLKFADLIPSYGIERMLC